MPEGFRRTYRINGNIIALPPLRTSLTGEKRGVFRPETFLINRPNQKLPEKADRRWCHAEDEQKEETGMGDLPQ